VPYLVTEFVLGTDMGTLVEAQGPLSPEQALTYLAQTALGLSQLHRHGVVHRNLKPQVLLVDVQGQIKITNLLLAKIQQQSDLEGGERLTLDNMALGTADYMAPEQIRASSQADGRADLYALGCTLHFLLSGAPPYPGKTLMEKMTAHLQGPLPSLRAARGDVSPALEGVFRKLLAKEPADRYASAEALLDELGRLAG
jgi:serine/threonine-protein kinase